MYVYTRTHTYTQTHTYIYTCNEALFSHKKEEILPFVTARMDLEDIKLNERSQKEKGKYCMISLICGI